MREEVGNFILEPARLLEACKPGLQARMDSSTGDDCACGDEVDGA